MGESLPQDNLRLITSASRVVIKVGTSTLTHPTGKLNLARMERLARQMADLKNRGLEVVLVTSGAVGAGMGKMGLDQKPARMSSRQALAAIGQGLLMQAYEKFFSEYGVMVAQVLLTHADIDHRERYLNARNTLFSLLKYGALPIINENDTLAVEEIKIGDNDRLSAVVAGLVDADLLVILSDIKGLYTADPNKDPEARLVPVVEGVTGEIQAFAGGSAGKLGSGGMATKLQAAHEATSQGIATVLTSGAGSGVLPDLMDGVFEGTLFLPSKNPMGRRKGWIAFNTRPEGVLMMDEGAAEAIRRLGKSLLPKGVCGLEGEFGRGDVVGLSSKGEGEFARGIVNFSAEQLRLIMGRHTSEIEGLLGPVEDEEVVHRDNLSVRS
jgi:glutamate 5-kinase